MSEIKRRKTESFEAFLRRVKKRWQQSGKILEVKKKQFYGKQKNKNMRKKSALHRLQVAKQIEYLKKIGRMPEEPKKFGHR